MADVMQLARPYFAVYRARFLLILQYRAAAMAGMTTQLWWGAMKLMVLAAFYAQAPDQPLTFPQAASYIWLVQAFLTVLPWGVDTEIELMMRTGNVAYERLRPLDTYGFWFARSLALRTAPPMLRAGPIFLIAGVLLSLAGLGAWGLRPPDGIAAASLFVASMTMAILLSAALTTLTSIRMVALISGRGLNGLMSSVVLAFSGMILPLQLFPDWMQTVLFFQPFAGLMDIPFRIYFGDLTGVRAALGSAARLFGRRCSSPWGAPGWAGPWIASKCLGDDHERRVALLALCGGLASSPDELSRFVPLRGGLAVRQHVHWVLSHLGAVHRFGQVHGWTFAEVGLFYGVINVTFAFADMMSHGFERFGREFIKTGDFDRVLLRPRAAPLQLLGHELRLQPLGRLAQGALVLGVSAHSLDVQWGWWNVSLVAFAMVGGVALYVGLMVLQATLSFWTVESVELVNILTYGGAEAAQYPLDIYAGWFRKLLTFVVPVACISYYPLTVALGRWGGDSAAPEWLAALSPLAGFVFLALSLRVWTFGVSRYTSAGG